MILLTGTSGGLNSFVQFITVLLIFLFVLVITYFVTKWVAKYQKTQSTGNNIEVMETQRISSSKYIQIIRIGEHYYAIAVCKDTVTMLSEIEGDGLSFSEVEMQTIEFKTILEKAKLTSLGKRENSDREK